MKQVREQIRKAGGFLGEVGVELRKTTWPQRRELTESTVAVMVFIVILSLFVLASDRLILALLRVITRVG